MLLLLTGRLIHDLTESLKTVVWEGSGRVPFPEADLLEVLNTPVDGQAILKKVAMHLPKKAAPFDCSPSKLRLITDEGDRLGLLPSPGCVWGGEMIVTVMHEQTGGGKKKKVDDDDDETPPFAPVGLPKLKKRPPPPPSPPSPSLAAAATPAAPVAQAKKAKGAAKRGPKVDDDKAAAPAAAPAAEDSDDEYESPMEAEARAEVQRLRQQNAHKDVQIAKLRGALAEANRKLDDAGSEQVVMEEEADEGQQIIAWRPFQQDILTMVNSEASDRAIYWIYSLQGSVGKTLLAKQLITLYDALIIDPQAAKRALDLIRKQYAESPKFAANPILLIDLVRSASTDSKKLYQTLETIQGSFSDSDGTMTWQTPPHVIVFANDTPETGRLSADRLRVFLVTRTYELQQAKFIEAQLKEEEERLDRLQAEEEEAARTGEMPQRLLARRASGAAGSSSGTVISDGHLVRRAPLLALTCGESSAPTHRPPRPRAPCAGEAR